MNKIMDNILVGIKDIATKEATANVNSACVWYHHQPAIPASAMKLRKAYKDDAVSKNDN